MLTEIYGDDETEERLRDWGRWLHAGKSISIGFAHECVIGRCIREGPSASQGSGKPAVIRNTQAEEIDQIIARMPDPLRTAVIKRWGFGITNRDGGREMNANKDTFDRWCFAGKAHVAGVLRGIAMAAGG